jgi:hypothetical protein
MFDFILVFTSIGSQITMEKVQSNNLSNILRLVRFMKVLRLVKLLNFFFQKIELFNQVKVLIKKIFLCLPLCKNVLTMLFFIFYIFAIIGVEIFNPAPLNNSFSKRDCSI